MSIVKKSNPFFPLFVNEFFRPDWFGGRETLNNNHVPAVNIKENEKGFELDLAVPGYKKEDFNVEVDNDILSISTELKSENEKKEDDYTRREFSYTSFKRSFSLPETINGSKIVAHYEGGILSLTLPKKEEALPKPKRLIQIA